MATWSCFYACYVVCMSKADKNSDSVDCCRTVPHTRFSPASSSETVVYLIQFNMEGQIACLASGTKYFAMKTSYNKGAQHGTNLRMWSS